MTRSAEKSTLPSRCARDIRAKVNDGWQSDDDRADDWKDPDTKAREAIAFMLECQLAIVRMSSRPMLLDLRTKFHRDRRMADFIAMIDQELDRRASDEAGPSAL